MKIGQPEHPPKSSHPTNKHLYLSWILIKHSTQTSIDRSIQYLLLGGVWARSDFGGIWCRILFPLELKLGIYFLQKLQNFYYLFNDLIMTPQQPSTTNAVWFHHRCAKAAFIYFCDINWHRTKSPLNNWTLLAYLTLPYDEMSANLHTPPNDYIINLIQFWKVLQNKNLYTGPCSPILWSDQEYGQIRCVQLLVSC